MNYVSNLLPDWTLTEKSFSLQSETKVFNTLVPIPVPLYFELTYICLKQGMSLSTILSLIGRKFLSTLHKSGLLTILPNGDIPK